MKISIIIPAYNEEKRIGKTLEEYCKFFYSLKKQKTLDFEILIVINNTKDKTEDVVKKYSKKYKEIRYLNFKQGGKGFAIIEGFKDALKRDNDLIGFVDADMSTSPKSYYDLIKNIGNYDGTIASRGLTDSVVKTSLKRKINNKGFNFLVRSILFLPYKDTQCGAKIFRRNSIKSVLNELGITQWAFDIDLLYRLRKKGFKIKEIPTVWDDKCGSSVSMLKTPIQMFFGVIRLRIINSPFKRFIMLYDKIPESMKIHHNLID